MLSISMWCGFHVSPFCCRREIHEVQSSLNSLWHCAQRQVTRNGRGSLAREISFRRSYRLGYFQSQFYFVPAEGVCFWGLMPMLQSQDKLQCCIWKRIPELQNQGSWWKEEFFFFSVGKLAFSLNQLEMQSSKQSSVHSQVKIQRKQLPVLSVLFSAQTLQRDKLSLSSWLSYKECHWWLLWIGHDLQGAKIPPSLMHVLTSCVL